MMNANVRCKQLLVTADFAAQTARNVVDVQKGKIYFAEIKDNQVIFQVIILLLVLAANDKLK